MELNSYRTMWVIALFDLPVDTPKARKEASDFRKKLKTDGFTMLQFSVYGRHCPSEENAQVHIRRIEGYLPPDGQVRVLVVTEKQFERMRVYWGKMRKPPEEPTRQLMIF
jgi:CRISPR-associated protein Cas2